jgi:hypothetical protein
MEYSVSRSFAVKSYATVGGLRQGSVAFELLSE